VPRNATVAIAMGVLVAQPRCDGRHVIPHGQHGDHVGAVLRHLSIEHLVPAETREEVKDWMSNGLQIIRSSSEHLDTLVMAWIRANMAARTIQRAWRRNVRARAVNNAGVAALMRLTVLPDPLVGIIVGRV
jgi:hypothetical protein